ncbi:MAG: DUF3141 domain-containing protein, partial [Telluria sp.]
MDAGSQIARSADIGMKVATLLRRRNETAVQQFTERVRGALDGSADPEPGPGKLPTLLAAANPVNAWRYAVDAAQRSILFWDTMRRRGNEFVASAVNGLEPVLHFDAEQVLDGRGFERPVNYALLRIVPPAGVRVDPRRRPYLIIDPRAGHGPGIGGFKDDSQVGVALAAGHPVYFVIFYRDPEPGQTML